MNDTSKDYIRDWKRSQRKKLEERKKMDEGMKLNTP